MHRSTAIALITAALPAVLIGTAAAGTIDFSKDPHADRHTVYVNIHATMSVMPNLVIPIIDNGDFSPMNMETEIDTDWTMPHFSMSRAATIDIDELRPFMYPALMLDGIREFYPMIIPALSPATGLDIVPTPGSMALLGAGGLGLIARRGN